MPSTNVTVEFTKTVNAQTGTTTMSIETTSNSSATLQEVTNNGDVSSDSDSVVRQKYITI